MIHEPTPAQRRQLQQIPAGRLALVQFLAVADPAAFAAYLPAAGRAVAGAGGRNSHAVHIDQVLAGGEMPYEAITVDAFPSGAAALQAFDALQVQRQAALAEVYALLVRPLAVLPRIARRLGFLGPLLSRLLGTTGERALTGFAQKANPQTGPVPATLADLRRHDPLAPFYMMNLNRYYDHARYANGRGGERRKGLQSLFGCASCPTCSASAAIPTSSGTSSACLSATNAARCTMPGMILPWSTTPPGATSCV